MSTPKPPPQNSPSTVASQGDLFKALKGTFTEADRLKIYHATKRGKIHRAEGAKGTEVLYRESDFLEWISQTEYTKFLGPEGAIRPDGSSEEITTSPVPPSAVVEEPALLVDVEVVEDHAAPRATSALVCINAAVDPVGPSSDEKEFHRLDAVVRAGYSIFVGVGLALKEIRDRELWRHGRFPSWDAYCSGFEGMSKRQANRLISSAKIAVHLSEVGPIGPTLPYAESQVRPLAQLTEPYKQVEAWFTAVERAGGAQPTGKLVAQVVAEMVGCGEVQPPPEPDPKPDIARNFNELLEAVRAGLPHNEIEGLLTAFGTLIGVCQPSSTTNPNQN